MKHSHGENLKDLMALVRLPNLLIVALTMMLMRYAVLRPLLSAMPVTLKDDPLNTTHMTFQLGWLDFVVLVVSTVLITAAGYVINDYFDIRTDLINRGRIIVGNTITRRKAMMYHIILNGLGVAGGFYVSARIGYFWLGIFFLLVSGLLYFYSAAYKRQFLIGNLIVAFLTAMVPLMVVLYDAPAIYSEYSQSVVTFPGVAKLFYWVGGFALFAFLTTLIREIIKDMEDYDGDLAMERKTLPVSAGIITSKIVVVMLSLITLLAIYIVWFRHLTDKVTLVLITLLIAMPFVFVIYSVTAGKGRRMLHNASRMMKIIMLFGILYSLVAGALITAGKIF